MELSATTRIHLRDFQSKLFAEGEACEEVFTKLCEQHCENEVLAGLLFAVCTLAVGHSRGWLHVDTFSTGQVKRLATDLRSLAGSVDRLNKSALNPKFDFLWAPPDATRDSGRKYIARYYDMLPGIMMTYSFHLERFYQFRRTQLKRLTFVHFNTLELLRYVEERTGGPRYENLSNLLSAGFLVAGGAENDIPKIFSADALAKLKQRWRNRPSRNG